MVSCENSNKVNSDSDINSKISLSVVSFCDATEDDFNRENSAFPAGEEIKFTFDHYRLVKVTYKFTNNNDFSVTYRNVKMLKNDDFYIPPENLDIQPTYPIASGQSLDIDVYIYVNKDLTNESELENKLNALNVEAIAYKDVNSTGDSSVC